MEIKNLKKTIRKTAELLSEAYGIDEDFVLAVLTETFTVPKSKVPHRKIVDGEPMLSSELDFYFQPNIYTALRDLPVPEVISLFSDTEKRSKLKQIENDFRDMKDNCPMSPFSYIADCISDFRQHLYYERRGLRLTGNTSKPFPDCGILDQYFTNRWFPVNFALPRRFDRDSVHGRQSLYSKMYWDFKQENPMPNERFYYTKLSDGTVEVMSSAELIPAQDPSEPKLPFSTKELFFIKKERYGELWTSFRFKHFHTNPDDIDFSKFDRDQFLSQIIAFREFTHRADVIEKEKTLRRLLSDFTRLIAIDFKHRFLNVKVKANLQRDILKKLRSHPINEFSDTLLGDKYQIWNPPKSLADKGIFFADNRLKKMFKLAMLLDFEGETKAITQIQNIFKNVLLNKYFSENGGYNYFNTSLYRAMEDIRSAEDKKMTIHKCLEKVETSTIIYSKHKSVFELNFTEVDSNFLNRIEKFVPSSGYEFGDQFKSFKNYKKNIEIKFSKRQAEVVEMLVINDCFEPEKCLGTHKIINKLYSEKERKEKFSRLNSESPFRIETEVFSTNHLAITSGLIKRSYSRKTNWNKRKERTYYIDPLFLYPAELPKRITVEAEQFDLRDWNKKDNEKRRKAAELAKNNSTNHSTAKSPRSNLGRVLPRKTKKS